LVKPISTFVDAKRDPKNYKILFSNPIKYLVPKAKLPAHPVRTEHVPVKKTAAVYPWAFRSSEEGRR
jgi:hypothetical protein